jgi:hypothetical protein
MLKRHDPVLGCLSCNYGQSVGERVLDQVEFAHNWLGISGSYLFMNFPLQLQTPLINLTELID